jgi:lambda family phage portal protein
MGASVGGFLEWDKDEGPAIEEDDGEDYEETFIEPEAGVFQELAPGLRHKSFDSRYPSGEFTPFHKAMLRGAGAGMGVAYVNFANDLEGVNFSSIRQGVLNERDHWMDLQEWLIETLVDRAYQAALEIGLLMGLVTNGQIRLRAERIEKYRNVLWQARRWAWVDPQKDISAEVTAMENMLTSPSEIIRKSGRDPTAVWQAFAADIEAMKQANIPENIIMATLFKNGGPIAPRPAPPKKNEDNPDDETD